MEGLVPQSGQRYSANSEQGEQVGRLTIMETRLAQVEARIDAFTRAADERHADNRQGLRDVGERVDGVHRRIDDLLKEQRYNTRATWVVLMTAVLGVVAQIAMHFLFH